MIGSACMALSAGEAKAGLVYELLQQGSDIKVNLSGSLSGLSGGTPQLMGGQFFSPSSGGIYLNGVIGYNNAVKYSITGPSNFGTSGVTSFANGSLSGTRAVLQGSAADFLLDPSYIQGSSIAASGILTGKTLSSLGLSTTSGLLATWTFNSNPTETIQVWAGPAAPAAAPGPLPLVGAGAAYAFSRRLRSRIRSLGPQAKP